MLLLTRFALDFDRVEVPPEDRWEIVEVPPEDRWEIVEVPPEERWEIVEGTVEDDIASRLREGRCMFNVRLGLPKI